MSVSERTIALVLYEKVNFSASCETICTYEDAEENNEFYHRRKFSQEKVSYNFMNVFIVCSLQLQCSPWDTMISN